MKPHKVQTRVIKIYRAIPYINKLSLNINKTLKTYDYSDVKLAYRPIKKLQNMAYSNTKDIK